jgi:hypothetical protein
MKQNKYTLWGGGGEAEVSRVNVGIRSFEGLNFLSLDVAHVKQVECVLVQIISDLHRGFLPRIVDL